MCVSVRGSNMFLHATHMKIRVFLCVVLVGTDLVSRIHDAIQRFIYGWSMDSTIVIANFASILCMTVMRFHALPKDLIQIVCNYHRQTQYVSGDI